MRPGAHDADEDDRPWWSGFGEPRMPWSWRVDGTIAAVLGLLTVATRWPLRSRILYTWDSIWFALGMESYDVAASRPHPPGYPLFVAAARFARAITGEANEALVLVAVLAGAAAVAVLYGLVRHWGSRRAALAASALFAADAVFFFNGIVALSYTVEALLSISIVLLAWRAWQSPTRGRLVTLGIVGGVALGLRPTLGLFLGPVAVMGLFGLPRGPGAIARRAMWAGLPGAATVLAWFVPMLALTPGGWAAYADASGQVSERVVFARTAFSAGWPAVAENAERLRFYLEGVDALAVPFALFMVAATAAAYRWRLDPSGAFALPRHAALFWAIWLLPPTAFYLLVFSGVGRGPTGYVLDLLPALYAAFGIGGDGALRLLGRAPWPRLGRLVAVAAVPLLLVPVPFVFEGALETRERQVVDHDAWADSWAALPESFPPENSSILAWYNWAHVKWYFPEYTTWGYLPVAGGTSGDWVLTMESAHRRDGRALYDAIAEGPTNRTHAIPATTERIVLFDFQLAGENDAVRRIDENVTVHEAWLPNGWRVLYVNVDPDRPTIQSYYRELAAPAALAPDFRI